MAATRLFDTCVFAHHLRGVSPEATELVKLAIKGQHPAAFSIVTDAELWVGVKNDQESHIHRAMLYKLTRLPLNLRIARRAGDMRRIYRSWSLMLFDAIIAATAEQYNLPLYTHNVKHFNYIPTITVIPYQVND